jgi:hypothetical protein
MQPILRKKCKDGKSLLDYWFSGGFHLFVLEPEQNVSGDVPVSTFRWKGRKTPTQTGLCLLEMISVLDTLIQGAKPSFVYANMYLRSRSFKSSVT